MLESVLLVTIIALLTWVARQLLTDTAGKIVVICASLLIVLILLSMTGYSIR